MKFSTTTKIIKSVYSVKKDNIYTAKTKKLFTDSPGEQWTTKRLYLIFWYRLYLKELRNHNGNLFLCPPQK